MDDVRIERATSESAVDLARLKLLDAGGEREPSPSELQAFTAHLLAWWADHEETHSAYIARTPSGRVVGAAWVALIPRVPRPGALARRSADIQSVYVVPESRGRGWGSALVEAACSAAEREGGARIVAHASERAVPLYRRLGFATSDRLLQRTHEV